MSTIRMKFLTLVSIAGLALCGQAKSSAADEPKPLATAKHPKGLVVEVLEVTVDDTQDKLKVVWRYRNPTSKKIQICRNSGPARELLPPYKEYFNAVSVRSGKLSEDNALRHGVVKTVDGKYYDATDIRKLGIIVGGDETFEIYAKFGKPANNVERIHLQIPDVPLFEDLPITRKKAN